ncbi:MAG: alpha/beta hydrolase [Alphaproteobacteria bacterium]|nr:alpha/beta hydrolase [Alphaproteobacteria bacterium]
MEISRLPRPGGATLAYAARKGESPGLLWLGGFKSDMTGTKATALDAFAARTRRAFIRFDYFGHGASSGDFRLGTISRWRDDALCVLDELCEGPQILIGSSMGGWIATLAALARPEKVKAILYIAPAPDFTEKLLWAQMPQDVRRAVMEKGEWLRPSAYDPQPYVITRALIEDGASNNVLDAPIPIRVPVRVLHGMQDEDVPWTHALRLVDRLESTDIVVTLVKTGDHRLSTPADIARLEAVLEELIGA